MRYCNSNQSKTIAEIFDGLCKQIEVLESEKVDATQVRLLLSSVLQHCKPLMLHAKNLLRYVSEYHIIGNLRNEVQNLKDPTLTSPEKCSSIFTTGELKCFSAVVIPLKETTYTTIVCEGN